MLIRYGIGINEMRGSAGGVTIARNRFGSYARSRTKPVNPRSQRQMGIRTIMMFLAEQWRESPMTDLIRTAWQTYADSVNWTNKLGESVTLTGFNTFVAGNAARITAGGDLVTAAPAALGLPAGDPAFAVTGPSAANQAADTAFDDGFDWCSEDNAYMALYMGKPQSPSHNFFGGPFRFWRAMEGSVGVPLTSPQLTKSGAPFTIVAGQKIWYEARIIRADGRISSRFRCDPVIAGA